MKYLKLISVLLVLVSPYCLATEGGGSSYPVGVDTYGAGLMRPAGFTNFLYFNTYDSDNIRADNGHDNPIFPRFSLKSQSVSWRMTYVWPDVKWLGANVETRLALPLVSLDRDMSRALPGGGTANLDASRSSIGDLTFLPVALGWHGKHFHQIVGVESFIPIGSYDKERLINTGRNYYQLAPFYGVTWRSGGGWEASARLRYGFNGKNSDTDYRSGNEATIEYSAGFQISQRLHLGVNGFFYKQTTDDKQSGVKVNGNGNRGEEDAVGPYVRYTFTPKFTLMVKWLHEYDGRNKSEGDRIWLQTILPF